MDVPILHRMRNEFDHRNLWLQLVLGLISAGERLDALLDRDAPAGRDAIASHPAAATEGDEILIAFVLGLVATKTRLHALLDGAMSGDAAAGVPVPADPLAPPRALRDLLR